MCNENTRRRREKGAEKILEVLMTKIFPKLISDTKPQIQEAQKTPTRMN